MINKMNYGFTEKIFITLSSRASSRMETVLRRTA